MKNISFRYFIDIINVLILEFESRSLRHPPPSASGGRPRSGLAHEGGRRRSVPRSLGVGATGQCGTCTSSNSPTAMSMSARRRIFVVASSRISLTGDLHQAASSRGPEGLRRRSDRAKRGALADLEGKDATSPAVSARSGHGTRGRAG